MAEESDEKQSGSILEASFNEAADVIDSDKKRGILKPITQLDNFFSNQSTKVDLSNNPFLKTNLLGQFDCVSESISKVQLNPRKLDRIKS